MSIIWPGFLIIEEKQRADSAGRIDGWCKFCGGKAFYHIPRRIGDARIVHHIDPATGSILDIESRYTWWHNPVAPLSYSRERSWLRRCWFWAYNIRRRIALRMHKPQRW